MPRPKRQKIEIFYEDREIDRLDTHTTKSLAIPKTKYNRLLRRDCKHSNYVKAFDTLRKQDADFVDSLPTFNDFIVGTETFYFDLPYPIVKPYICDEEIDFCTQIFEEKSKYREKLKNFSRYYKNDQKWLTKVYVEKTKYTKLPKYMIDLAVGNVKDPDVQFEGIYNWYYTGGTMSNFFSNNEKYLTCTLPNNNLRIVNINDCDDVSVVEMSKLNPNTKPIFNLQVINENLIDKVLITRQRNSINVYHLLGEDSFSLLGIFKLSTKDKNPILDVKYNSGEMAYLDYTRKLNLININVNKSRNFKFKKSEFELSDPFCQLEYLNENDLGFIDRNTLRFLDVRSFDERIIDMNEKLFLCDDLCYVKQLKNTPYLFLATVHNIKKVDVRTNKVVKTWAHLLSGQPSMFKIEKSFYGDMLFLSSSKYNERVILCSNADETNLVQLVPNNFETFKKCNIVNFDLNSKLYEHRLKFSTSGIEIVQSKDQVSLYSCNTLGDIFQTNVRTFEENMERALLKFIKWRENFKRKPTPCVVTHLRDMSNAKFILKKPIREDALKKYTKPNKKRLEYIAENTIEGSAFAHIWIGTDNVADESLAPSISANNKVTDWLERVNYDPNDEEE